MGLIRGGLLVITSVVLFAFFLIGNSLLVVSNSLEYENIQEELVPVITEIIDEQINLDQIVEDKLPAMESYCVNNSEFVFNAEGRTLDISCGSIEQGNEMIVKEIIEDSVEEVYYQEYDCGFIECLKEQKSIPFFLLSAQTQSYFENKFYIVMLICLGLSALVFLLVESKTNMPILVGALLVVSSLPFLKLDSIAGFFADKSLLQFFTFLFTQSYSVFIKSFILGLVLIAIGIFFKFFNWGFKISEFIGKFRNKNTQISQKNVAPNKKENEKITKKSISVKKLPKSVGKK